MASDFKRPSESQTVQVQVLSQAHLNGYSRLFGGQLMSWMDVVAAVAARRHSGRNVTTARVDGLEFHHPAYANDTMELRGRVVYAGTTSMIVKVEAYIETLDGQKKLTNRAWFLMVALDEHEKPTPVPALLIETDEEKEDWRQAEAIKSGYRRQ